ncbi:MAG: hypothetical protein ABFC57_11130 [Veillonellales bacterium]
MWLKLLGSCLVLAVGTTIGFQLAKRCIERPRQIRQIATCLVSLKSYISYAYLPLAEALQKCTTGTQGVIADFFQALAAQLEQNGWLTPREAMQQIMKEYTEKLAVGPAEIEILLVMGSNLGSMNREEQVKYLDMIEEQLLKIEQQAIEIRNRNTKMYRYLGICGSLAVIILLI